MGASNEVFYYVKILTEMIEEAQAEVNRALSELDKQMLRAKRDALSEAKFRIRGDQPDLSWTKHIPSRK